MSVLVNNMLSTSLKTLIFLCLFAGFGCGGDSSTCDPGTCPDGGTGSDLDAVDAPFVCDPVQQTGCAVNTACYSDSENVSGTAVYTYTCEVPGAGTDGANCVNNADCAAGFWCAKGGLNKCTHYCTTDMQCTSSGSPTCLNNTDTPWGYCACANPAGIGTCP